MSGSIDSQNSVMKNLRETRLCKQVFHVSDTRHIKWDYLMDNSVSW